MYIFIFLPIIIIMLLITINIYLPQIKGRLGETTVSTILSTLPKEQYITLNNIMINTNRGTAQIDHVVVSQHGIFVIETKNYKGWITGHEYSEQWTKNVYGKKYSFRNPIKQNYGHVKALQELLKLQKDIFIPIVVFSVNSELKVKTSSLVIYTARLKKTIGSFTEKKLSTRQMNDIIAIINSYNVNSKENRKIHVEKIHNDLREEAQNINNGNCPKCGGNLVKRKGRYGEFMGCSNFPKCRYTSNRVL